MRALVHPAGGAASSSTSTVAAHCGDWLKYASQVSSVKQVILFSLLQLFIFCSIAFKNLSINPPPLMFKLPLFVLPLFLVGLNAQSKIQFTIFLEDADVV